MKRKAPHEARRFLERPYSVQIEANISKTLISAKMEVTQWTRTKFVERYIKLLPKFESCAQAYEAAEIEHKAWTGRRRYKNFDVFKNAVHRYWKEQRS